MTGKGNMLLGYDNNGTVYDNGNVISRQVNKEYLDRAIEIFEQYQKSDLNKIGIVKTEYDTKSKIFNHKKHIISYPFEWTANMYKDAVLFHLRLFIALQEHGLILKDALPNNIVYDFCNPVFVDFLSLIKKERLNEENWLFEENSSKSAPAYLIIESMFVPYMLIPFCTMEQSRFGLARQMLFDQACNTGSTPPSWKQFYEIPGANTYTILKSRIKRYLIPYLRPKNIAIRVRKLLKRKTTMPFDIFCQRLLSCLDGVNFSPENRGYTNYYKDKKEDFDLSDRSAWKRKQQVVYQVMEREQPGIVLDIGANTGWFSMLAEKMGANVISTDIDESAIDSLYCHAKTNQLKILPLKLSFDELNRKMFGYKPSEPGYENRDFDKIPLFLPATERLQADLVLCLALAHHLILGEGLSIESIFSTLSTLTKKVLVLEFIDLNDQLIIDEPDFFKNLDSHDKTTYNLEAFITEGEKHFTRSEVVNSQPETRKLLVFSKTE